MWGAGSVGGLRIPWAVLGLDLRLDQDLFYERARPHLTGIALDDGEKEGFGSKINCHLTEIPSSIVAAFPISKECAPVQTVQAVQAVQAVQGTLQTVDINWRSLVIIFRLSMIDRSRSWFRARQLNFNEWAIGLQKEWQWSVGDTRRNQEYFSSNTCDLWPCECFMFYQSGELARWKPLLIWGML